MGYPRNIQRGITHLGENYGSCAPIASGSICTADGIVGNELCNLASGIGIYGHCVTVSTGDLPAGATAAQIELDALAKYKAGFSGGEYWDRASFPSFVKNIDNNNGVAYADAVTAFKTSTPWTSHLNCPC